MYYRIFLLCKVIEGLKGINALNALNESLSLIQLLLLLKYYLAIEELLGCDEYGLGNTLVVL